MENLQKKKYLPEILTILGVLVVGYYAWTDTNFTPPVSNVQDAILDSKTGVPLSQEQISAISQKQDEEMVTHTLGGKVIAKLGGSLHVEATTNGKTRLLRINFAPNTIFMKNVPLPASPAGSSDTEEKEISFADVKVGDSITVTFPRGIVLSQLDETNTITVSNLSVDLPHRAGFEED